MEVLFICGWLRLRSGTEVMLLQLYLSTLCCRWLSGVEAPAICHHIIFTSFQTDNESFPIPVPTINSVSPSSPIVTLSKEKESQSL
jgi:hypothetical protein